MEKISFNSTAIIWNQIGNLLSATQPVNSKASKFAKNLFSLNNVVPSFFNVQKNLSDRASVLTNTSNQPKKPNSLANLIGIVVLVSAVYFFNNLESPLQNEPKPKNKFDDLKAAQKGYSATLSRTDTCKNMPDEILDNVMKLPDAAERVYLALENTDCGLEKLIETAENVKKACSRALLIPLDAKIRKSLSKKFKHFAEIVDRHRPKRNEEPRVGEAFTVESVFKKQPRTLLGKLQNSRLLKKVKNLKLKASKK